MKETGELVKLIAHALEEKKGDAVEWTDGCLRFDARPYGMFTIYAAL